ncbi:hypothetical protein NMG60_11022050 [Bertholletia excelsa]
MHILEMQILEMHILEQTSYYASNCLKSYMKLVVLKWCGHDGGVDLVSLGEVVTADRVRLGCGLLTEAFMCQRLICMKNFKATNGCKLLLPEELKVPIVAEVFEADSRAEIV